MFNSLKYICCALLWIPHEAWKYEDFNRMWIWQSWCWKLMSDLIIFTQTFTCTAEWWMSWNSKWTGLCTKPVTYVRLYSTQLLYFSVAGNYCSRGYATTADATGSRSDSVQGCHWVVRTVESWQKEKSSSVERILGAFSKLQKGENHIPCVCHWAAFYKILYPDTFRKYSEKIQIN